MMCHGGAGSECVQSHHVIHICLFHPSIITVSFLYTHSTLCDFIRISFRMFLFVLNTITSDAQSLRMDGDFMSMDQAAEDADPFTACLSFDVSQSKSVDRQCIVDMKTVN